MVKKWFALLSCVLVFAGCVTSPDEVKYAAEAQGLVDVQPGDWTLFGCAHSKDSDEKYGRKFSATNVRGMRVHGVVCCGMWAKGCTVRW